MSPLQQVNSPHFNSSFSYSTFVFSIQSQFSLYRALRHMWKKEYLHVRSNELWTTGSKKNSSKHIIFTFFATYAQSWHYSSELNSVAPRDASKVCCENHVMLWLFIQYFLVFGRFFSNKNCLYFFFITNMVKCTNQLIL